ncbi:addiction module antidote protein [Massilia rubra]|uniref:Addiction module antidote protein n=1 Tax=Massilia rubra TaxID=2607910 RepID=A0ABX0LP15_9BURK|nr:addiction module antidote protein [Massilia rubra]NHZ36626.1 putative addiction module antidote protein [Massilia rubra]
MKTAHIVSSVEDEFDMDLIRTFPCFEPADYLDSEEAIVGFVNVFLEEDDTSMLVHALETVAQAPGMLGTDELSASTREELFVALREESSPRLDTVMRVMKSLGLRLVVEPVGTASDSTPLSETPETP